MKADKEMSRTLHKMRTDLEGERLTMGHYLIHNLDQDPWQFLADLVAYSLQRDHGVIRCSECGRWVENYADDPPVCLNCATTASAPYTIPLYAEPPQDSDAFFAWLEAEGYGDWPMEFDPTELPTRYPPEHPLPKRVVTWRDQDPGQLDPISDADPPTAMQRCRIQHRCEGLRSFYEALKAVRQEAEPATASREWNDPAQFNAWAIGVLLTALRDVVRDIREVVELAESGAAT